MAWFILTLGGRIAAVLFAINGNYTGTIIGVIIAIVGLLHLECVNICSICCTRICLKIIQAYV